MPARIHPANSEAGVLYVGTSGWNYPDWSGIFYPGELRAKDYLAYYSRHFATTEVNYSFYHLPRPSTYSNWDAQVPAAFRFAVKASRTITHIRRLAGAEKEWAQFLGNARTLGPKLGPVLLQLPPSFRKDIGLLRGFLAIDAGAAAIAVEFRHSSWFDGETFAALRDAAAALVIAHSARYPQAPLETTAPFVYLRFHGPGALFASIYSEAQLREWARAIRAWLTVGLDVYAYFNNDYRGYALDNARQLLAIV